MGRFPPTEIALKIALSLGLGLLVGLEREWAHKDLGVRTFTIAALLGMLGTLAGAQFALAAMVGLFVVIAFVNGRSLLNDRSLETTTSVALLVTFVLGVLIGQGHLFTPVASAIVVTMLLAWKTELRRFAGGLAPSEVRSAVLLGLLGFVVYPILPNRFVDPWQLLNPRESWTIVLVIAGIGFINYVLLRLYSAKGLRYTAVLGGLVNSTATVAELMSSLSSRPALLADSAVPVILLTVAAMASRNLIILALFAPRALPAAVAPLLAVTLCAGYLAWRQRPGADTPPGELRLSSPISMKKVMGFGLMFLAINAAGSIVERFLGKVGFWFISLLGGFLSSASTTAAAASMFAHGRLSAESTATAVVTATAASTLVNIPFVLRQTKHKDTRIRLIAVSIMLVLVAFGVLSAVVLGLSR